MITKREAAYIKEGVDENLRNIEWKQSNNELDNLHRKIPTRYYCEIKKHFDEKAQFLNTLRDKLNKILAKGEEI